MSSIFDGIEATVPKWESPDENRLKWAQMGQETARNFTASMQVGMQMAEQAAVLPEKLKSMAADTDAKIAANRDNTNNLAGFAQLAQTMSEGAGKWTDPDFQSRIYKVGADYPSITKTKTWMDAESRIDTAQKLQTKANELQAKLDIEEKRNATKQTIAETNADTKRDVAEINVGGRVDVAKIKSQTDLDKAAKNWQHKALDTLGKADFDNYHEKLISIRQDPNMSPGDKAKKMDLLNQRFKIDAAESSAVKPAVPATAATPSVNEVQRMTPDGKKAIFNSETKEFLRYAD